MMDMNCVMVIHYVKRIVPILSELYTVEMVLYNLQMIYERQSFVMMDEKMDKQANVI